MNIVASLLLSALTYAVSDGCDTVLTEAEACCVFPFEYNGEKYCDCTSNNWFRPWCSLTPFYAGKWGHCPDDQGTTAAPTSSGCNTVRTKEGDCCHFPFEYKGETYCKCTSNNWVRPWCSLTPIYEGMWGHCPDNQPTTAPPVGTTTAPPTTSDNQPTTTPPVGTTTAPPTTSDNQPTTATPWVTTAAPRPPTTSEAVPCGSRPPGTRIVGGTQAQNGSWPWMAMLAFAGGSQFCGGSLILEEWVLTAARCVDGFSPSQIVVRMGAYKITDIAQELQVDRIIMHEEYDNNTFMNDIALLKLKTKATLSAGVGLVCPLGLVARENTLEGETGYITGWGSMSQGGTQPNYLQEAALQVISNSECQIAYNRKSVPITRSMMCTEPDEGAWRGACHGDSGGPLVWEFNGKWHIAGISSWGRPACSDVNFPDVYTRVGEYAFWIKSSTKARYI